MAGAKKTKKPAWTRDPEAKKQKVVETATGLFLKQGYQSVSTAEIARTAGISEALLFHYFGSKRGLADQIAEVFADRLIAVIQESVSGQAAPDIEKMVGNMFAFVSDNGTQISLLSDGGLGDVERAYRQRIVGVIRELIERWIADGLVPDVNSAIVAELVYSGSEHKFCSLLSSWFPTA